MNRVPQPAAGFSPDLHSLAAELYAKCGAEKFSLTCDQLGLHPRGSSPEICRCSWTWSAARILRFPEDRRAGSGARLRRRERARLGDLHGRYREKLYEMGLHIAREDSAARELADSLYADLYGTVAREGQRVSKLASYTGRGSLEGWLRTVMAQEHVNRYRRQKRNGQPR